MGRWVAGGRHEWVRGRFPGRHELECRLVDQVVVRLICEGWLPQDPCSSPGSQSKSGRHPQGEPAGCP
jgi:hypothetical protein